MNVLQKLGGGAVHRLLLLPALWAVARGRCREPPPYMFAAHPPSFLASDGFLFVELLGSSYFSSQASLFSTPPKNGTLSLTPVASGSPPGRSLGKVALNITHQRGEVFFMKPSLPLEPGVTYEIDRAVCAELTRDMRYEENVRDLCGRRWTVSACGQQDARPLAWRGDLSAGSRVRGEFGACIVRTWDVLHGVVIPLAGATHASEPARSCPSFVLIGSQLHAFTTGANMSISASRESCDGPQARPWAQEWTSLSLDLEVTPISATGVLGEQRTYRVASRNIECGRELPYPRDGQTQAYDAWAACETLRPEPDHKLTVERVH
jgi:hypothetical protein